MQSLTLNSLQEELQMADERNGLTVADVAALSGGGMGGFGNGLRD